MPDPETINPAFLVSVDTEEDNWGWASTDPVTCSNIREIPKLTRFFQRLGIRPTFFVAHAVLSEPSSRDILRELASEEWMEFGAHVHPWNTPPFDERVPRRTMLYEYPVELQAAKIASVTALMEETLGRRPTSFRAGRFGFGVRTVRILVEQGYRVDSSVTPYRDWRSSSHGPSYLHSPLGIYRIKVGEDVLQPHPAGELVEVPLTSGFSRLPTRSWRAVARTLDSGAGRILRLDGAAVRVSGLRRVILSPEIHPAKDMADLSERVLRGGVGHLQLFFHSSSMLPGLNPFTRSQRDVAELYDRMECLLEEVTRSIDLRFSTVGGAGHQADPAGRLHTDLGPADLASTPSTELAPGTRGPFTALGHYPGLGARTRFMARYLYWRMGGYRRYSGVRWSEVRRVVFVCTGNICRSAYAEHWAASRGLPAASLGVDTRGGDPADATATAVAARRGVDMTDHRTRPLAAFPAREGDLFVAMEPRHLRALERQKHWTVPHQITLLGFWIDGQGPVILDPYGRSDECFEDCFLRVERGVETILRAVAPKGHGPHTAACDV